MLHTAQFRKQGRASVLWRHRSAAGRARPAPQAGRLSEKRRGAVLVESAIIMFVFITLTVGAMDLELAVFRYNMAAQAARHGARQAMVHGALAKAPMTVWGPAGYSGKADDGSDIANAVSPLLVGFDRHNVTVQADWLDGGNAIGNRVRYTVSTPYRPLLGFLIGYPAFTISAASTMPIAH